MPEKEIAIIGCGPRGLYSLECLVIELSNQDTINIPSIFIFDDCKDPGAGQVWKVNQNEANWINISVQHLSELKERPSLEIKGVEIPKFHSFVDWAERHNFYQKTDILTFPPRSVMGRYLSERFQSIAQPLIQQEVLTLYKERIVRVSSIENSIVLQSTTNKKYTVDECLVTIGHQPVSLSEEMRQWQLLANKYGLDFIKNPYDEHLLHKIDTKNIAIRGIGLAMIDVVRLFALKFGHFIDLRDSPFCEYECDNPKSFHITPYSPDGLPPVPKPYTTEIDKIFDPGEDVKKLFKEKISNLIQCANDESFIDEFLYCIVEIIVDLYLQKADFFRKSNNTKSDIRNVLFAWLKDMNHKHELFLDINLDCKGYMEQTVLMAHNLTKISLDYLAMQVWRHLQPTMYVLFSHCDLPDEVMEKIVELDENSKRYTFGPPVDSIKQLIALSDKGILDFNFAKDPSIEITKDGWKISSNSSNIYSKAMIDSVLASPLAKDITSPLFADLIEDRALIPVSANLGFKTYKDARIFESSGTARNFSLCMIGRYCKGSVLGVDAILECFGREAEDWSKSLVKRIQ